MLIQLLVISFCVTTVVQSAITNNGQETPSSSLAFPNVYQRNEDHVANDEFSQEDDGNNADPDDYAQEDNEEQLADHVSITTTSRTPSTVVTTTKRFIPKSFEQKKTNDLNTKIGNSETDEFNEYDKDNDEDDIDYSDVTNTTTTTHLSSTRPSSTVTNRPMSFRSLLSSMLKPPVIIGILGGLAIGILLSVVLLICIVRRFNRSERTRSSYTTGLLYPNQYGYLKSTQEFYA